MLDINRPMRINGHGHLLPYADEIPKFMKERKLFWIDEKANLMCQDNWSRPITDKSFFLNEKLEWMDKNEIDKEVLLNLSQLYCNGYNQSDTHDVIRFQNDFNASVQQRHPDRFISGFVVQPLYVEDALKEISRCYHQLNMRLLCLPTHFLSKNNEWLSVADESVVPIFELANELNLAVEIHPYNAEAMVSLKDKYWRFHLIWMCAQTADTAHLYTLLDYPLRFPNVRVCFAHGNQYGQVGYGRRMQGYRGRPDLFVGGTEPKASYPNLFFDTLVHDVLSFELMIKRQGVAQIVAGLDDPYPLGEMESVPGSYPGKVIDEAVAQSIISPTDRNSIWNDNVMKWLYG